VYPNYPHNHTLASIPPLVPRSLIPPVYPHTTNTCYVSHIFISCGSTNVFNISMGSARIRLGVGSFNSSQRDDLNKPTARQIGELLTDISWFLLCNDRAPTPSTGDLRQRSPVWYPVTHCMRVPPTFDEGRLVGLLCSPSTTLISLRAQHLSYVVVFVHHPGNHATSPFPYHFTREALSNLSQRKDSKEPTHVFNGPFGVQLSQVCHSQTSKMTARSLLH
jgi:hypothetical protein